MLCWLTIAFFVLLALYVYYRFLYQPYQYLKVLGVPGPAPTPLLGNLGLMWKHNGNIKRFLSHMTNKYGRISGFYLGPTPVLCVSDVDFLKEVMLKQFDNYINRFGDPSFEVEVNGKGVKTLDFSIGENWRNRRQKLTPAFSTLKMKLMEPLVKESTDRLKVICGDLADDVKSVDAQVLFSKLTMEVILSVAFGQALDVQNGQGGDLYKLALTVINAFNDDSNKSNNIAQFAIMGYPQLSPMMGKLLALSGALKPVNDLIGVSKNVVDKRRASKDQAQRNDLLQLMIEASQVEGEGAMTYEETIADCLLVLLAGYDTSSNTLAFVTYLLAVHQDVQERLATEIGSYFQDNPESSMYEASHELEYLEMVICEALRMYPPATMTSRVCEKDCITQGLSVRKGTLIFIPTVDIHHDPELWEDPEKFDPERFSKENKSSHPVAAYQPFGVGPRNCIGMRFAQLEIKMTLIEVLRNYRITTTPDTKIPLKETCGTFIQRPMPGEAMIGFQRRNN